MVMAEGEGNPSVESVRYVDLSSETVALAEEETSLTEEVNGREEISSEETKADEVPVGKMLMEDADCGKCIACRIDREGCLF